MVEKKGINGNGSFLGWLLNDNKLKSCPKSISELGSSSVKSVEEQHI
jgi:hypothetical protein